MEAAKACMMMSKIRLKKEREKRNSFFFCTRFLCKKKTRTIKKKRLKQPIVKERRGGYFLIHGQFRLP